MTLSMSLYVIVGGRFQWKGIIQGLIIYVFPLELQLSRGYPVPAPLVTRVTLVIYLIW